MPSVHPGQTCRHSAGRPRSVQSLAGGAIRSDLRPSLRITARGVQTAAHETARVSLVRQTEAANRSLLRSQSWDRARFDVWEFQALQ